MKEDINALNCIRTFTGKYVNLINPDPETICIEDIAHGLSNMPRFAGQLPDFYSVAQHSVLCTAQLYTMEEKLEGLLHDATEAYLMDIPKPLKNLLPEYRVIEERFSIVIAEKFGTPFPMSKAVKTADVNLLSEEWDFLFLNKPFRTFGVWPNKLAEKIFLKHFNYLTKNK